ncbi:helix-turn-helix transcriptional regulator [Streptacidiphilus sp. 4-A2]|nr:helix-turn-helix transcriptional regulator [Streptacidiphilus sp. 4-A2]
MSETFRPAPLSVPTATASRRLAEELTSALMGAERREGRSIDRGRLARQLSISPASLYAYLSGSTVPRAGLFDRLLEQLGVTGRAVGHLASLRDAAEAERRSRRSKTVRTRAMPSPGSCPPPRPGSSGAGPNCDGSTPWSPTPDAAVR